MTLPQRPYPKPNDKPVTPLRPGWPTRIAQGILGVLVVLFATVLTLWGVVWAIANLLHALGLL